MVEHLIVIERFRFPYRQRDAVMLEAHRLSAVAMKLPEVEPLVKGEEWLVFHGTNRMEWNRARRPGTSTPSCRDGRSRTSRSRIMSPGTTTGVALGWRTGIEPAQTRRSPGPQPGAASQHLPPTPWSSRQVLTLRPPSCRDGALPLSYSRERDQETRVAWRGSDNPPSTPSGTSAR